MNWRFRELDTSDKLQLQRVRLNSGGYDASGYYWGIDAPLWEVMDKNGDTHHFRAADRDAAKAEIQKHCPDARFYR